MFGAIYPYPETESPATTCSMNQTANQVSLSDLVQPAASPNAANKIVGDKPSCVA